MAVIQQLTVNQRARRGCLSEEFSRPEVAKQIVSYEAVKVDRQIIEEYLEELLAGEMPAMRKAT